MNSYQQKITMALLIVTFLSAIEVTIVSTAMPVIVNQLGGLELISWVFAVYLLTSAVTTPIFGKLADLFGRKIVFMVGVTLFLLGSFLCGLSQSMEQLIVYRAIQGIGAGALMPVTFTIIGDVFSFEQRGKVQGLISSMWGIAGIFGPLVGGFFVDFLSWHWIFYINIPFGLISMILIQKYFKEEGEHRNRKIDYGGALTFTIGTTALLFALLTGGNDIPWNSVTMYVLIAIAAIFLIFFIWIQLKHPEPMLPIHLLRIRSLAVCNLSSFMASGILIGLTAYLPLWIQGVLQMGATSSGLTLTPMSIGWPIGAVLCGKWMVRLGFRPLSLAGMFLIVLGSFVLTTIGLSTPTWLLVITMFVIGFGFGLSMTVFMVIVQSSVEWSVRGVATSTNTFIRVLGQTLGIAVLGTILNQHIGEYTKSGQTVPPEVLANGLHSIFLILAVLAIVGLLATFWIPSQQGTKEESKAS